MGLPPAALGSLGVGGDGSICGQLGADEDMAKWMRDSQARENDMFKGSQLAWEAREV